MGDSFVVPLLMELGSVGLISLLEHVLNGFSESGFGNAMPCRYFQVCDDNKSRLKWPYKGSFE